MKAKPEPSLLPELFAAALCVWVAAYHSPVGVLARAAVARVRGQAVELSPVLASFSLPSSRELSVMAAAPTLPLSVPSQLRGVRDVLALHPTPYVAAVARLCPMPPPEVDALESARACALQRFGSDEAATLALFVGPTLTTHAVTRAQRSNAPLTVASLARFLPPGDTGAAWAREALTRGTAYGVGWPVALDAHITSPFGWRTNPVTGHQQLHTGVDVGVPSGTPIAAGASGVVVRVSEDAINGRMVVVDHGHGVTAAFCHASSTSVARGDVVTAGHIVAKSGSTGRSTGPHLHYQLALAGQPVDPLSFR